VVSFLERKQDLFRETSRDQYMHVHYLLIDTAYFDLLRHVVLYNILQFHRIRYFMVMMFFPEQILIYRKKYESEKGFRVLKNPAIKI